MKAIPGSVVAFTLAASTAPLLSQSTNPSAPVRGNSQFELKLDAGAIISLKRAADRDHATEFIAAGRRLGDVVVKYRQGQDEWQSANTATLADTGTFSSNPDGTEFTATFPITNGESPALVLRTRFQIQDRAVLWTLDLQNAAGHPVGDLDLADVGTNFGWDESDNYGY